MDDGVMSQTLQSMPKGGEDEGSITVAFASSASLLCLSLIMAAKDALQLSSHTCSSSSSSSFPDRICNCWSPSCSTDELAYSGSQ